MSKINWKVRIRNERFWLSIIPVVLLLIEQVFGMFGYKIDLGTIGNQLKDIVETVFIILGIVGGFVGSLVFSLIGFTASNVIGSLICGIVGSCIVIFVGDRFFNKKI